MKSGFIILFLEIFGVQLCNFLLSVKSEIAYIFLLIQVFPAVVYLQASLSSG